MQIRRALFALVAALGVLSAPSLAQSPYPAGPPAPVPALPDSARITTYTITSSTCACAVGFDLYGDSTDYQSWVEVWLNGVKVAYNDATYGWTITSASGGLSTLPRPITNGVLTFNNAQTGTVQIVGAQRPRRLTEFSENRGVAARDLNQAFNSFTAIERETWDRTADISGRALLAPPGETLGIMPKASSRAGMLLSFDSSGNPVIASPNTASAALPQGDLFVGNASGVSTAVPMSGDCSMASSGGITCTKTNGSNLGTMATQNVAAGGALSGSWPSPSLASGAASSNVGTLGGDLSGTLPNPTVAKVQGLPYKGSVSYSNGQTPTWNSTNGDFEPGSGGGSAFNSAAIQIISSCNGTGDDSSFTNALAALPSTGGEILVTAPTACMITSSSTLNWSNRRVVIAGVGPGYNSGQGTVIQCSTALTGPCITMQNGAGGLGSQSGIKFITLVGSDTAASARDGVDLQCNNCFIQDAVIKNFGGFCVHILSGTSSPNVSINANNWQMRNVYCTGNYGGTGNQYEIAVDGQDSNAGTAVGVTVNSTHAVRSSFRDASALGNTWVGPSCVNNLMSVSCFMIDGYPSESAGTTYKGHGVIVQGLYVETGVPYGLDVTSGSAGGNNVNFLDPNGSTAYTNDNTTNHNNIFTWWNATSYCQYLNGTKSPAGC